MKTIAGLLIIAALGMISAPALADDVRVMTYNIRHGRGMDDEIDLERIAAVIRAADPDIVCLQEVDRFMERSGGVDQPAELGKLLNMQAVFEPNLRRNGGEYGNATLARLELVEHENIPLPQYEDREPRGALRTRFRKNGVVFDVFNTHFGLVENERRAQASALLDRAAGRHAIIAGDINEEPGGPSVRILGAAFTDAGLWARDPGMGTYPAGADPERRIDYVFASPCMNVLSYQTLLTPESKVASDHLPCLAVIGLPKPPRSAAERGIHGVDDERIDDAAGERP